MRRRRFYPNVPNHVCRRPKRKTALFYCLEDCLVFFTVFCVNARRFGINVMGLALMYDHIHETVKVESQVTFSAFHRRVATDFSTEFYSDLYDPAGLLPPRNSLFEIPFLSAPKYGEKNIRTNLAYLYNNPVERQKRVPALRPAQKAFQRIGKQGKSAADRHNHHDIQCDRL